MWDLVNDSFWVRHNLLTGLVTNSIVVAVTVAVLNEVLERRKRQRWSVLAQYALFDLLRTARLVWAGLLELAGRFRTESSRPERSRPAPKQCSMRHVSPRRWTKSSPALTAANISTGCSPRLGVDGREVLARWADVMVNSGTYAEIFDRHVELYIDVAMQLIPIEWWTAQLPDRPSTAEDPGT